MSRNSCKSLVQVRSANLYTGVVVLEGINICDQSNAGAYLWLIMYACRGSTMMTIQPLVELKY